MIKLLVYIFAATLWLTACRTDDEIVASTSTKVTQPDAEVGMGVYLLNEGNMGSNKATIDYFDYSTGIYSKNIYAERNPEVVYELGDVGNDIEIYGDRLYAVINCSNLVEVMDAATATHRGVVSIPNCRYITFSGDYAYVSSYAGEVGIDPNARLGYVAKVDLESLEVVAECTVGYQPEDMAVADGKLYVAASGGYMAPNFDNRVSIIDLDSFTLIENIEVGVNLHRMELDEYGYLWVSSRGDYGDIASCTYIIDTASDSVVGVLDVPNSNMTRSGDKIYICSSDEVSFTVVDTRTQTVIDDNFIKDGTQSDITTPYGIAANPTTGELFITDAKGYYTSGKLHCYSSDGVLKWSVTTGDIPSAITFYYKN